MSCGSEIVHLHPKETFVAVRIRMKRLGRKHRPFFRICVMDSRSPRDGKAIEELGFYDPMVRVKKDRVKLNLERVDYWIGVGAAAERQRRRLDQEGADESVRRSGRPAADDRPEGPPGQDRRNAAGGDDRILMRRAMRRENPKHE